MSERDKFDWNDDMDFESLADEQEAQLGDDSSFGDLTDFEDLSDFDSLSDEGTAAADEPADSGSPEESFEEQELSSVPEDAPGSTVGNPGSRFRRKKVISPLGLGFTFAVAAFSAAIGIGGVLIPATGIDPSSLWDPSGLGSYEQWVNFHDYPLNLLYAVAGATTLIILLGSWVVARAAAAANKRFRASEELLDKLTGLRLDNEEAWQDPAFKTHPAVVAFVTEILGSWRLQQSKQVRSLGVEGELHRLEKALSTNSRTDLVGRFDSPAVGSLADELTRWFDELDAARKDVAQVKAKDQHEAESILSVIQDARSWNRSTLDQIGVQGAALERLAVHVKDLAVRIADAATAASDREDPTAKTEQIKSQLTKLEQSGKVDMSVVASDLNDLVDKVSKLAFQIAMEVARLGSRGERLLPMTQSLEEMTTEFRQVSSQLKDSQESGGSQSETLAAARIRLDELAAELLAASQGPWNDLGRTASQLGPAAMSVSGSLTEIARAFNNQGDRLTKLGESCSELTGAEFDASDVLAGNPEAPPEGELVLAQFDPFGKDVTDDQGASKELDPFASAEPLLSGTDEPVSDLGFSTTVTPGQDSDLLPEEESIPESSGERMLDLPDSAPEPELSDAAEKVYDLEDLGAVAMTDETETNDPDAADNRIYDLEEFGAVALQ